jgi:DNA (cytosine-5)-methyltransferase 1
MTWRHLDLFSGIGGFALACRMAGGIETVAFCERDKYCQRVLAKHWPDVPICNDIHDLKGNDYGTIDIITGGFPCQPYSLAGERRGNKDDRALWPQMLRVISEARPAWVLGENVPGIVTLALDGVLADLEGEGYACETLCIPACGVDAKHRRERVWIVAHATGSRINGESRDICKAQWGSGVALCGEFVGTSQNVANTDSQRGCCGTTGVENASHAGQSSCHWKNEADWFTESGMGRMAHGVSRRVDRLRGLGNAIVPQVAAEIIRCMKGVEGIK